MAVGQQKTAFPPNYVHSLDASHMMMTALQVYSLRVCVSRCVRVCVCVSRCVRVCVTLCVCVCATLSVRR